MPSSTDEKRLFASYRIDDKRKRGSFIDSEGHLVAFARTHGYQEYDGQGWVGIVRQRLLG